MAPARTWNTRNVEFDTSDRKLGAARLDHVRQVKQVEVVQVLILAVTPAKRDDAVVADGRNCQKAFAFKTLLIENVDLMPSACDDIENPQVLHVGVVRLAANHDHQIADKTRCVIRPRQRKRRVVLKP